MSPLDWARLSDIFREGLERSLSAAGFSVEAANLQKSYPLEPAGGTYVSFASKWYPSRRTASMRTLEPMLASFLRRKPTYTST